MTKMKEFISLNVAILAVSDKQFIDSQSSIEYLASELSQVGHQLFARDVVSHNKYSLRAQVSAWIADDHVDAVLLTGGTGFSEKDSVPEALMPLFDKEIDGFGELFRQLSYAEIGTSTLKSRALAGMANKTMIFCLPSSLGACKTAWQGILKEQLDNRHRPCNFVCHTAAGQRGVEPC